MSNPTPTGHKHKTVFTTLANTVWHLCWHVPSQKKPPHKMESLLSAGRPQQKRTVISSSKQGLVDRLNWAKNQNWSGGRSRTARDKETMLNQPASPNFSCSTQDSLTGRRESVELGKKKKKRIRNFTNMRSCSSYSNQLPHTKWEAGVETKLGLYAGIRKRWTPLVAENQWL